jgi:hypothetical protein
MCVCVYVYLSSSQNFILRAQSYKPFYPSASMDEYSTTRGDQTLATVRSYTILCGDETKSLSCFVHFTSLLRTGWPRVKRTLACAGRTLEFSGFKSRSQMEACTACFSMLFCDVLNPIQGVLPLLLSPETIYKTSTIKVLYYPSNTTLYTLKYTIWYSNTMGYMFRHFLCYHQTPVCTHVRKYAHCNVYPDISYTTRVWWWHKCIEICNPWYWNIHIVYFKI